MFHWRRRYVVAFNGADRAESKSGTCLGRRRRNLAAAADVRDRIYVVPRTLSAGAQLLSLGSRDGCVPDQSFVSPQPSPSPLVPVR